MQPIERTYADQNFPARHHTAMPADRLDGIPWLIAGRLLFAPFAPRDTGLTAQEADAIEAMGKRLERDRQAGLLPDSVAYWFAPIDGHTTPLTADVGWLRSRVMQNVVVDLRLLEVMGRVVPLTLLIPTEQGYGARAVRRAAPAALKPTRRPKQAVPIAAVASAASAPVLQPRRVPAKKAGIEAVAV
jgi:hypothetical protein